MTKRRSPVLYVDDEEANLVSFRYCFEDEFDVLTAGSGAEALSTLASRPVAVLVADQRMPEMGGAELCARARKVSPDTVRIAVTAYADLDAAISAINDGQVSRYVLKPWDEAEMLAALRTATHTYELSVLVNGLQAVLPLHLQEAGAATALRVILHELSNPATAVQTTVLFMGETLDQLVRSAADAPPASVELVAELRRATADALEGCRELTRRLKGFGGALVARQANLAALAGTPSHDDQGTDVGPIVESTVSVLRREIARRATLVLDLADVPRVRMSARVLSLVLMNLLVNAIEAIAAGCPSENSVRVRVGRTPDVVTIEVADTGSGISAELLTHVYEPFFSTKASAGSRGLGLAVVRDLARAVGGDVTVTSEVGRGSAFTITLPIKENTT